MGEEITVDVAAELVASQFPDWSDLPVTPVPRPRGDNHLFRLGDEYVIRMPRDDLHVPQVAKEHQWLPELAPLLPLRVPEPVAIGRPGERFPRRWSVNRWIPGRPLSQAAGPDGSQTVDSLTGFLGSLHSIDAGDGPPPGSHSFHRGGALAHYDDQTRSAIDILSGGGAAAMTAVWDTALETSWTGRPRWVHGDLTPSNILVVDGDVTAVIDFGCCAVGDPACDLVMAWTWFRPEERARFRAHLDLDAGTWARARGWALWKALVTLVEERVDPTADDATVRFGWRNDARRTLDIVVSDPL